MKVDILNLKEGDIAIDYPPDKKLLEFIKSAFEYKGGYIIEVND